MRFMTTILTLLLLVLGMASTQSFAAGVPVRLKYTSTSVLTTAYTQLVASTVKGLSGMTALNTGSNPVEIAFGASGSEQVQVILPGKVTPVGMSLLPVYIPASAGYGTRVSVIALDGSNTTGELELNLVYN